MNIKISVPLFGLFTLLFLVACEKEVGVLNSIEDEGYLQVDLIVIPMIHPYAESVSLIINEVRIGAHAIQGLRPEEELLFNALIEPLPMQLGSRAVLTPGGYANLSLDLNTSPTSGSHVNTQTGSADALGIDNAQIYTIQSRESFLIADGFTTKRVMLVDLNKLIRPDANGLLDFSFRENVEAGDAVRLYDPKAFGHITGVLERTEEAPRQTHRLVVYAYESGAFNQSEEIQNGFYSAIISSNVRSNDEFTFPVLPQGVYDLVVVHYIDENQDGVLEFKELLQADPAIQSTTRIARVSPNAETSVRLKLGGVVAD